MRLLITYSLLMGLFISSINAFDIILKKDISLGTSEVCLKDIADISYSNDANFINKNKEYEEIEKQYNNLCLGLLPKQSKKYLNKEIESLFDKTQFKPSTIVGDFVQVNPVFKKLPKSITMDYISKLKSNLGENYQINFNNNEDTIIIPEKGSIYFDVNLTDKMFLIKTKDSKNNFLIWADYPLIEQKIEQKVLDKENPTSFDYQTDYFKNKNMNFDVKDKNIFKLKTISNKNIDPLDKITLGRDLTLIFRKNLISIKMPVKSLETAMVGQEIKVKSYELRKVYRAVLINNKEAEIVYE